VRVSPPRPPAVDRYAERVRHLDECRSGLVASCRRALDFIPADSRAPTDLRDVLVAYKHACDAGALAWCVPLSWLHLDAAYGPPDPFAARAAADKACLAGILTGCLRVGVVAMQSGDLGGALASFRDLCRQAPLVARERARRSRRDPRASPRVQACLQLVERYRRQPSLAPAHCVAALEKFLCGRLGGYLCGRKDVELARMVRVPFPHECTAP
jgi:hypothetical protein